MIKNPLAMQETQETQVRSLGGEDPLEKEMATHTSILVWRIPWDRKESDTTERLSLHYVYTYTHTHTHTHTHCSFLSLYTCLDCHIVSHSSTKQSFCFSEFEVLVA